MDCRSNSDWRAEGKQAGNEMLSISQKLKRSSDPDQVKLGRFYEGIAHSSIGSFDRLSKESYKEEIKHYQKARDIYLSFGDTAAAKVMESNIEITLTHFEGNGVIPSEEADVKRKRDVYKYFVQDIGESSIQTLQTGVNLVATLIQSGHHIESQRLASKLAAISLRVYGPEHDIAKSTVSLLKVSKLRRVTVLSQPGGVFDALEYNALDDTYVLRLGLGYEANGGKTAVKALERDAYGNKVLPQSDRKTFTVASNDVHFLKGTPVVCHGLKNAAHLNGKIGETTGYKADTDRYEVHFEDKSLKPVAVKRENLRIVFELPALADEDEAAANADTQTEKAGAATTENREAAAALLAELDLEETKYNASSKRKGKKKRGKKNRKK